MRLHVPEIGQGPRERYLGLNSNSATNSLRDPGPQVPPLHIEGVRPAPGPQTQMPTEHRRLGGVSGGRMQALFQAPLLSSCLAMLDHTEAQGGPVFSCFNRSC